MEMGPPRARYATGARDLVLVPNEPAPICSLFQVDRVLIHICLILCHIGPTQEIRDWCLSPVEACSRRFLTVRGKAVGSRMRSRPVNEAKEMGKYEGWRGRHRLCDPTLIVSSDVVRKHLETTTEEDLDRSIGEMGTRSA